MQDFGFPNLRNLGKNKKPFGPYAKKPDLGQRRLFFDLFWFSVAQVIYLRFFDMLKKQCDFWQSFHQQCVCAHLSDSPVLAS